MFLCAWLLGLGLSLGLGGRVGVWVSVFGGRLGV